MPPKNNPQNTHAEEDNYEDAPEDGYSLAQIEEIVRRNLGHTSRNDISFPLGKYDEFSLWDPIYWFF